MHDPVTIPRVRAVMSRSCHQFAGIYQHPWPSWGRLEVPTTSTQFLFIGCLGTCKLDVPNPHIKIIDPSPLSQFLPWSLVLHWLLLPSLSLDNCWGLLVVVFCGFCIATHSCTICSLSLMISSFPSAWVYLAWMAFMGQSSSLTQPCRLLPQVEDMISLYYHKSNTWNCALTYETHEKGNP